MLFGRKLFKRVITLFFIPLITLSALNADSELSIYLTPNQENRSDGSLMVTMTNNATEPIKVLKWNTPLEEILSANIFSIESNKKDIKYRGRLLKRGQPQEEDYVLFEAGESRTITIKLPTYYKMVEKGEYKISYRGNFSSLSDNLKFKRLKKSKKSKSTITLSFTPTEEMKKPKKQKVTPKFNGCSEKGIEVLNQAHDSALTLIKVASNAMKNASANTTGKRYVTWFGKATEKRQSRVTSTFSNIYDALENKKISYDCSTCTEDGTFAYVYPDEPYNLYLCGSFWSAEVTGTDSRAGTFIHELSHFVVVSGTDDYVYGQDDAKKLAKTSPDKAIDNADNYEFFAEDTPHISMESGESSNTNNPFEDDEQNSNSSISDSISKAGETNLYELTPSKDVEYTIYTTGNLDTYGILYNSQGNLLKQNDDMSSSNYNFGFSYKFSANRTYYLEVGAYKTDVGNYVLHQDYKSNQTDNPNTDTNSNSNGSSSKSSSVPSLNYLGLLLIMILTLLFAYKEIRKI